MRNCYSIDQMLFFGRNQDVLWYTTKVFCLFLENALLGLSLSCIILEISQTYFNPFVPRAHFLYPLKTSENLTVPWKPWERMR